MTFRHVTRGRARHALPPLLFYALMHAAACSGTVEGDYTYEGTALRQKDDDSKDPKDPKDPKDDNKTQSGLSNAPSDQDCADLATDVEQLLTEYCAACHGNGNRMGGFGEVLEVAKMIDQSKIVPGDPGGSKLFKLVKNGTMPKTPNKPNKDEIALLNDWIECGAPDWEQASAGSAATASFTSIDDRIEAIRQDLRSFDTEADRLRMRYIDFTNLANAGLDEDELDAQRALVSLLTNSLSFAKRVVEPVATDKSRLLYRIDLRDYAWDEDTWERIVADYPYAVRYDEDSPIFSYDEDAAEDIREETGTNIPYIQADWFIDHVSQPPLYYDVLEIPENLNQLFLDQGVDVEENIRNSDVARAGFNGSGVSLNNRVIERHELPGFGGALWLSYDFASNVDEQNVFANPSDFEQDGGEGFFNLPNGLQVYFIYDANFRRLDKAPTNIVSDPNTRDRAVAAGLSCMGGCHLPKGINQKDDQVRDYVLTTAASANERDRALELYPEVDVMNALMESDIERYGEAIAATKIDVSDDTALIRAVRNHEDVLTLEQVAAVLGIKVAVLDAALDASPQAFPPEIVALRVKGASVYRATFDALVEDVVEGLGLGESLRAGRNRASLEREEEDEEEEEEREEAERRAAAEREEAERRAAAEREEAERRAAAAAAAEEEEEEQAEAAPEASGRRRNRR